MSNRDGDLIGLVAIILGVAFLAIVATVSRASGLPFDITVRCLVWSLVFLGFAGASIVYRAQWPIFGLSNVFPLVLAGLWIGWWPALDFWDTAWIAPSPFDYRVGSYAVSNGAWWASSWAKWTPVVAWVAWAVQRIRRAFYA